MGRKSREKKERRRNITEYSFSNDDGDFLITEIHPENSQPSDDSLFSKVSWTHRMGPGFMDTFLEEFIPLAPKKRVYLLSNKNNGGMILLGFYPELTERESNMLQVLTN